MPLRLSVKQISQSGTHPKKNHRTSQPQPIATCYKRIRFPTRSPPDPAGVTPPSLILTTGGTSMLRASLCVLILSLSVLPLVLSPHASAQDAATGAIHGTVVDLHDLRIPGATIAVVSTATGARYSATSDAEGRFAIDLLPPGDYSARVVAQDMSPQITPQLHVDVGAAAELNFASTLQERWKTSPSPERLHWSTPSRARFRR